MLIEEVGAALKDFQQRHPNVTICLRQSDSRDAQPLVADGAVDMALVLEPGPGYAGKDVTLEPAYDIDYLLIAPPRHPLAKRARLQPADLTKYPLVVPYADTYARHLLDQMLHDHGLRASARIAIETANSAFTVACVRSGLGVGVIAGQADGPLCEGLVVRSLARWLGQARIVFVRRRGALLSPILRQLSDTIRSATTTSRDKSISQDRAREPRDVSDG
jgi:DNA-binding transcriptional LysR family regulator